MIRRRDFITLLGGAAAWPVTARGQRSERIRRVGVLSGTEGNSITEARVGAFRNGLAVLGWTEGHNLHIDFRGVSSEPDRLRIITAELVGLAPEVILCGTPGLRLLQQTTRAIPIVFVLVVDPVGEGYVASIAKPGGELTGFASLDPSTGPKHLQLLKEIAPNITRVTFIYDPSNTALTRWGDELTTAGRSFGVEVTGTPVRNSSDIERSIEAVARMPNGGMYVASTTATNRDIDLIIALTARHRIPTIGTNRSFTVLGGLISFAIDDLDHYRRAASYVDRILKGEKPGDLPVQYPTKYQLGVNLKTAKALGITVPPSLLVSADEVIE